MALDEPSNRDSVLDMGEIKVLVDALSAGYVEGATVDFAQTAYGDRFSISGGRDSDGHC
ncbi:MAG: iron-sulfur cluster assembly accessory protein [Symbiobacteriia bacterium]